MYRQLAASLFIAAMIVLGAPSLALADHNDHDRDDRKGYRAPEPVTVIGLALGAGGIAAGRWVWGRRAARKRR
jgi:hypothetical protein